MSTAALALALAVFVGGGPLATRIRAGAREQCGVRVAHRVRPRADPLAGAAALDVFAVCLSSGMAVSTAATVTAGAAPPALAAILHHAADLLVLGADSEQAWTTPETQDLDEHSRALLRLARRSASSGAALAAGVADLAADFRNNVENSADAAAERAAVVIAGPLGVCFLPAFVCLGIVPVVAGLAGDVFASGLL